MEESYKNNGERLPLYRGNGEGVSPTLSPIKKEIVIKKIVIN